MATEAEIESLLVRIVGDNSQFRQALTESAVEAQKQMDRIGGTVTHGASNSFASMRMMTRGVHLLGMAAGQGAHAIHGLTMAFHAFHIGEHIISSVVHSMGALKGSLALGIGVAGAAGLIRVLRELGEDAKISEHAVKALHVAVQELSRPEGSFGLARISGQVHIFRDSLNEVTDAIASLDSYHRRAFSDNFVQRTSAFWQMVGRGIDQNALGAAQDRVQAALDNSVQSALRFERAMDMVRGDPRIQGRMQLVQELARIEEAGKALQNTARQVENFGLPSWEAQARTWERAGPLAARLAAEIRQLGSAQDSLRVFEQTRTAEEKFAEEAERLRGLLNAGTLDFDTYSRAINRAARELNGAAGASGKLNAVAAGSADAVALMRQQFDAMADSARTGLLAQAAVGTPRMAARGQEMIAARGAGGANGAREDTQERIRLLLDEIANQLRTQANRQTGGIWGGVRQLAASLDGGAQR